MSRTRYAQPVGWKHPLRAIVERGPDTNLLDCGHRVPAVAGLGRGAGKGKRQRCTGCPIEPPKLDRKDERRFARLEAGS